MKPRLFMFRWIRRKPGRMVFFIILGILSSGLMETPQSVFPNPTSYQHSVNRQKLSQ